MLPDVSSRRAYPSSVPSRYRSVVLALAVSLTITSVPAYAGGGGIAGATEVTQLANHVELISSVAQQATMVSQNVAAQIQRIQQTIAALQNLRQLPGSLLQQAIAPYASQLNSFQSLYSAVTSLNQSANQVRGLFSRGMGEMSLTGLNPKQWLSAYANLANQRGGSYKQQLASDMNSIQQLANRAQSLQTIQSSIPGVTGAVQGLQTLNQQSNIMAGEMMDLHALMARQVAQQTQDRQDDSDAQASAAKLALARQAKMNQVIQDEQQTIQAAPQLQILRNDPQ